MWLHIFNLLILSLLVETITEVTIKSLIFKPLRLRISEISNRFKELLSCGYCFSFWVSFFTVLIFSSLKPEIVENDFLNFVVTVLIVQRLSNFIHNFNDCWLDKYYNSFRTNSDK